MSVTKKGDKAFAETIFGTYKTKAENLIKAGDDRGAARLVLECRGRYRESGNLVDKKALDGAKAGRGAPKKVSNQAEETSFTKINNFGITKKVLLVDDENPVFTVALPLYNSRKIAWVAFDSLAKQKRVRFSWELVMAEEAGSEQVGEALSLEYLDQLRKAGCSRIVYIELKTWMPLFQKWMLIYQNSSTHSSKVFMLQAADCFSQIYRISETYNLFEKYNADWVQSKKGYFYNVKERRLALYDHDSLLTHKSKNMRSHPCSLNMAIKHSLLSLLTEVHCKIGVDRMIYNQIVEKNGRMKVVFNESKSYLTGVDTDGYNNLSTSRSKKIRECLSPFIPPAHELCELLPQSTIDKMCQIR